MAKKNRTSNQNPLNNHSITTNASSNQQLINHLNRIINTQDRINDVNFDLEAFVTLAAQQVQYLTNASGTTIEFIEDDYLVCQAATGNLVKSLGKQVDKNNDISGLCISTHQIIRSDDTQNDTRLNIEECRQIDALSLVVAPFFYEGNTAGVIKITSKQIHAFNDIDIQTLRVISGLMGTAIANQKMHEHAKKLTQEKSRALDDLRKSEKKLKHLSTHDYLTGLPNRNLFNDHLTIALAKAKRKKHLIALMYLDIDQFKEINDTLGHTIGDKLLHAFAQRLKQCIRSSDIASRFGGDEFILLIDDIKDAADVIVIADKILQATRQPFSISNKPVNITTSIGIAFLKDKEISVDDFVKQADQALYVSKNSGRNTFYIFDNELLYEPSQNL